MACCIASPLRGEFVPGTQPDCSSIAALGCIDLSQSYAGAVWRKLAVDALAARFGLVRQRPSRLRSSCLSLYGTEVIPRRASHLFQDRPRSMEGRRTDGGAAGAVGGGDAEGLRCRTPCLRSLAARLARDLGTGGHADGRYGRVGYLLRDADRRARPVERRDPRSAPRTGCVSPLLDAIVRAEAPEAERFWVAYAPENRASASGIHHAGSVKIAEISFERSGSPAMRAGAEDRGCEADDQRADIDETARAVPNWNSERPTPVRSTPKGAGYLHGSAALLLREKGRLRVRSKCMDIPHLLNVRWST
jgi:hypothetical protein